jgi:phage recombination protein Bet
MSENAVVVASKASPLIALGERFAIEPSKLVEVLRGTVIKPTRDGRAATNEEVAAFCMVANQYGLNPFTREIHAFADPQKGVVPIVGIDGWTHIVNAQPGFDGVEFFEEADSKGKPLAVTCIIHVKGRDHPVKVTERYSECYRPTGPWNTMPFRMLRHKAFMQTARYAFSLSGIYDDDEARDIVKAAHIDELPIAEPMAKKPALAPESTVARPAHDPALDAGGAPNASEANGQPPESVPEPSPEVADLISRIEPFVDGFPRMFARVCSAVGIGKDDWKTAPVDALRRLLDGLDAESARQ